MEKLLLKRPALCRSFLLLLSSHRWKVMLVISMMVTSCTKEDAILSRQHQSELTSDATTSEQAVNAVAGPAFPLRISPNGRYLVDQNNVPFLFNGDTGWFIFDKISTQDCDVYLDNRVAKGFTAVNIMAPWNINLENFYGEAPFAVEGNLSSPNEAWWARVDVFVNKASARGLLVNIVPIWLGFKGAQWYRVLPNNSLPVCRNFGRFLGNRYKDDANVMFTIGGDMDPGDRLSRLNEIALGIIDSAPNKIMSAHTGENKEVITKYPNTTWLNLNAVYTYFPGWGTNRHVYVYSRDAYNRTPVKPYIMIESGYEGASSKVSVFTVRRQAYWAMLSGATGFNYGNSSIWPFNSNWKTAMNAPGAYDMKHFYDVFTARPWYNLVPDFNHTVVTAGYGTFYTGTTGGNGDDYVTAARAADGKLIMTYLPSTGTGTRTLTVNMTKLTSSSVVGKWYNPTNGNYTTIGNFSNTNASQTFTTPGNNGESNNDWLLILEVGTSEDDTTPDQFGFTNQSGVELNTLVTSNAVTITGINAASPIAITGGEYQINSDAFTSAAGTVAVGNTIRVRMTSASTNSTTKSAVFNIGGVTGSFNVTTKSSGGGGTVTNLALNKPVMYAGQQVGNEAFKAVDGLTNTRWSWAPWPQSLQVDLGLVYSISQTELMPYANRAYQYKIEVSTDGSTYTTVVDRSANTTGGTTLSDPFSPVNARYVRLTVTGCSGYTGGYVSFYELRVLGN